MVVEENGAFRKRRDTAPSRLRRLGWISPGDREGSEGPGGEGTPVRRARKAGDPSPFPDGWTCPKSDDKL